MQSNDVSILINYLFTLSTAFQTHNMIKMEKKKTMHKNLSHSWKNIWWIVAAVGDNVVKISDKDTDMVNKKVK